MLVADCDVKLVLAIAVKLPNCTLVTELKFVPVIVTLVPPANGPKAGDTLLIDGAVEL